jgi:hypothetical protein
MIVFEDNQLEAPNITLRRGSRPDFGGRAQRIIALDFADHTRAH